MAFPVRDEQKFSELAAARAFRVLQIAAAEQGQARRPARMSGTGASSCRIMSLEQSAEIVSHHFVIEWSKPSRHRFGGVQCPHCERDQHRVRPGLTYDARRAHLEGSGEAHALTHLFVELMR